MDSLCWLGREMEVNVLKMIKLLLVICLMWYSKVMFDLKTTPSFLTFSDAFNANPTL